MSPTITHNTEEQTFYGRSQGHEAELAYSRPADGLIDFTHTFVDEALRGQGVGEQLARTALAYAREQRLRVRTSCSFMRSFVKEHGEYQDLLDKPAS